MASAVILVNKNVNFVNYIKLHLNYICLITLNEILKYFIIDYFLLLTIIIILLCNYSLLKLWLWMYIWKWIILLIQKHISALLYLAGLIRVSIILIHIFHVSLLKVFLDFWTWKIMEIKHILKKYASLFNIYIYIYIYIHTEMFCWVETTDKLLFMSNNLIIYNLRIQIIIIHTVYIYHQIYAIIVNYWIFFFINYFNYSYLLFSLVVYNYYLIIKNH